VERNQIALSHEAVAPVGPAPWSRGTAMTGVQKRVIVASAMGSVFEMYDFFLVGALASEIAANFFAGVNATAGFILTLLSFAAGFLMRPIGGIIFGRFGDLVGRKHIFVVTIVIMGGATFLIGLLPGFATIGMLAPIGFVTLRMLQGLALGGEFTGAIIFVSEHGAPETRTARIAWVVAMACGGLLLSLLIVLLLRMSLGSAAFADWGWRIPFLISIVLLLISLWIRLKLDESPEFLKMKAEGNVSKAPLREVLSSSKNIELIFLGMLGLISATGVHFYTGYVYAMFFLTRVLKVDGVTAISLVIVATIITGPLYIVFGRLADAIGRVKVLLAACFLSALLTTPLFQMMTHYGNPALAKAQAESPIVVNSDPRGCAFQFDPTGTVKFTSSCDIVRASLASAGLSYQSKALTSGQIAFVQIGGDVVEGYSLADPDAKAKAEKYKEQLAAALAKHGYQAAGAPQGVNIPMLLLSLVVLTSFAAMSFPGSVSMLAELFPTRVRYTAMSISYNVGSVIFGGFLPAIAFALVSATGDIFSGLWFTLASSALSFVVMLLYSITGRYTGRTQ
jgi:MFS family permease